MRTRQAERRAGARRRLPRSAGEIVVDHGGPTDRLASEQEDQGSEYSEGDEDSEPDRRKIQSTQRHISKGQEKSKRRRWPVGEATKQRYISHICKRWKLADVKDFFQLPAEDARFSAVEKDEFDPESYSDHLLKNLWTIARDLGLDLDSARLEVAKAVLQSNTTTRATRYGHKVLPSTLQQVIEKHNASKGDTTRSPQLLPRPAPDLPEPNDSPPMGPIPTSPIPDAAATTSTRQNSKPGTSLVIPETPLSSRRGGRLASPDLGGTSSLAAEYTSPSEGVGSGEGEQWWSPGRDSREHTPQLPSERSHLGGLQTLPTLSLGQHSFAVSQQALPSSPGVHHGRGPSSRVILSHPAQRLVINRPPNPATIWTTTSTDEAAAVLASMPSATSGHHLTSQSAYESTPDATSVGPKRVTSSQDAHPQPSRKRPRTSTISIGSFPKPDTVSKQLKALRLERDVLKAKLAVERNKMGDIADEINETKAVLEELDAIITNDELTTQHTSALQALDALGREFGSLFGGPGTLLDTSSEKNMRALCLLKQQLESSRETSISCREEAESQLSMMQNNLEEQEQELEVYQERAQGLEQEIGKIDRNIHWFERSADNAAE